ncbi:murein transglycosylase A [Sphingomonas sp. LY160]|uniref:murein transglycosylase A n=1 Tax=Sphingomonas sp. LY160 TaxID=3095342 RepID=UPI002ADEF765|nr:murein transglycosylase A [Sphingomonas sp. LY160]MEA1071435.1 murein transglycosylase A [Sphingomonas sp. LY160]
MSVLFRAAALSATLLLAACATRTPPPAEPTPPPVVVAPPPVVVPPAPPPAANARAAGVTLVAPTAIDPARAERALAAFRASCPAMLKRRDQTQLTTAADWQPLCDEARTLAPVSAAAFFQTRFDWLRVGNGDAFATGYYEPEIRGSRTKAPGYETPVYSLPSDLTRCTRADGQTGRGRLDETGACVLYFTRAEIEDGALAGRGLEMAWVADPIDLFFLQIQGSGRLLLPDGGVMRIGYENQNGREYIAIGRLLRERGILAEGKAGMKEIVAWMRANPAEGRALMRENPSYIFFRELTGAGPLGAMGVAVTPQSTVATDPLFVPLGAPVVLSMERPEASGLWIAQDTGGAIKGANRFDTFWGAGAAAEATAGGMSSKGSAILLLPKGAAARAQALR